jgi:hypothetical protein
MGLEMEFLQRMGIRIMAQVMEEGCTEKGLYSFQGKVKLWKLPDNAQDHTPGNVENPKAVAETGVCGPGIDKIGRTKLFYMVQVLKFPALDQCDKGRRKVDMFPHRISYWFCIFVFEMGEYSYPFSHHCTL